MQQFIGVFDSGMGGLTVLRALREQLPHEQFIYLGDTARLPYGTKSRETVIQYAEQNLKFLQQFPLKLLVIACNTASAAALPALEANYPNIPIIGVIEPGAHAASKVSQEHIAIFATETTIHSEAYQKAIRQYLPNATFYTEACNVLVALAEAGWHDNEVTEVTLKRYLKQLNTDLNKIETLILGCTHFPVFEMALKKLLPEHINIIDSAKATADRVAEFIKTNNLSNTNNTGSCQYYVTDAPARFQKIGSLFMQQIISDQQINISHI